MDRIQQKLQIADFLFALLSKPFISFSPRFIKHST